MKEYFIRRLLLVPVTMLGVSILVFTITRFVPGGPIDRARQQAEQGLAAEGGGSRGGSGERGGGGLSEDQIEELEEEYGYDKSIPVAYLQWLGVMPRERLIAKGEFAKSEEERIDTELVKDPERETLVVLKGGGRPVKVTREGDSLGTVAYLDAGEGEAADPREEGWAVRLERPADRKERWARRENKPVEKAPDYAHRAVVFKKKFAGALQGDFGRSTEFGDPVMGLIASRIPVALFFGILTAAITYGVCIPLGIVKAIKHRSLVDNLSSVLIFIGYSIPGFALGGLLLVHLGARAGWFPLFGLNGPETQGLPWWDWEWIKDRAHHTVLPLLSYIVGGFAWMTMMMKNNLMDNLAADYVRTAVAKGVSFRRAVFRHAFRNSFIPIAAGLGHLISIILVGSLLIEKIFDIQGFGLLQFQAVIGRDAPLIMGTLTISSFLMLIGNILSDVVVAFVDPRVKFN